VDPLGSDTIEEKSILGVPIGGRTSRLAPIDLGNRLQANHTNDRPYGDIYVQRGNTVTLKLRIQDEVLTNQSQCAEVRDVSEAKVVDSNGPPHSYISAKSQLYLSHSCLRPVTSLHTTGTCNHKPQPAYLALLCPTSVPCSNLNSTLLSPDYHAIT
jgi:hypothetical protein